MGTGQVNRAISRWAQKESKIKRVVEEDARSKAMKKKLAWKKGEEIFDAESVLDARINVKGLGLGTVVDYEDEMENKKKKKWGHHIVEFDSGQTKHIMLQEVSYKVLNERFISDSTKQIMREWQQTRIKKTPEQLAQEAEEAERKATQTRLGKLKEAKNRRLETMRGKSTDEGTSEDKKQELEAQLAVLREIFMRFDDNGDGILDRDEFEALAYELGFRGTAEQLDECWIEIYELKDFFLNDLVASVAAALLRNQLQARILS